MENKKFSRRDGDNNRGSRKPAGRPTDSNRPRRSREGGERFGNDEDRPRRSFKQERDGHTHRFQRNDDERPRFRNDGEARPHFRREGEKRSSFRPEGEDRQRRSFGDRDRTPRSNGRSGFAGKPRRQMDDEQFDQIGRGDYSNYKRNRARSAAQSKPVNPNPDKDGIRLNKYLSNAGICSRRDADKLIAAGSVMINGKIVTEMGIRVKEGDIVSYGGEVLRAEKKRYFLLNKPKGYITTSDDPQERKTVMMLIDGACPERIYPVGRLDRNTTGLLLFTNDGEMAKKLTHPASGIYKIYHVELDHPVSRDDMQQMLTGIELEDGPIHVDDVQYAGDGTDRRVVGVALHSGRNRIVRRIFEHFGYDVHKLDRVVFASLTKKDLPRGRYRELTEQEVNFLKMI